MKEACGFAFNQICEQTSNRQKALKIFDRLPESLVSWFWFSMVCVLPIEYITCDPTQANRRPESGNLSISVGNLLSSLSNRF